MKKEEITKKVFNIIFFGVLTGGIMYLTINDTEASIICGVLGAICFFIGMEFYI